MIISEKQIFELMEFTRSLSIVVRQRGQKKQANEIDEFLIKINNQQSEELMVIE